MSIDDLNRNQITSLINKFIIRFHRKVKEYGADGLLDAFTALESYIDENDPDQLEKHLSKQLEEAKKIIKESPSMTCIAPTERQDRMVKYNINHEANIIIDRINQACTPSKAEFVRYSPIRDSSRGSNESLNSLFTSAGDDYAFSTNAQPVLVAYNLQSSTQPTIDKTSTEPVCAIFSNCTIS